MTLMVFLFTNDLPSKHLQKISQVDQQARSAVIEFMSAESAENFTRAHNRRMIDLAILSVSRIA